jgi:hypothetical protein
MMKKQLVFQRIRFSGVFTAQTLAFFFEYRPKYGRLSLSFCVAPSCGGDGPAPVSLLIQEVLQNI